MSQSLFDMEKFLDENFETYRSGLNIYFNCPFCPKTERDPYGDTGRNYWFNPDKEYTHKETGKKYKGLGQCFKCEINTTTLSFVMKYKNLDLVTALAIVNYGLRPTIKEIREIIKQLRNDNYEIKMEEVGHIKTLFPEGTSKKLPKELIDWFVDKRSYPKELLKILDVRYCWSSEKDPKLMHWKNRALFPITTGRNKAFQGYLFKDGVSTKTNKPFPKTRFPPGNVRDNVLYLYDASKNSKVIIVHEGIFDTLRTLTRGFNPVGIFGTSLSFTQAYFLYKSSAIEICMCLDGGEKERSKAVKNVKLLKEICNAEITTMFLPDGRDPDDIDETSFVSIYNRRKSYNIYTRIRKRMKNILNEK